MTGLVGAVYVICSKPPRFGRIFPSESPKRRYYEHSTVAMHIKYPLVIAFIAPLHGVMEKLLNRQNKVVLTARADIADIYRKHL